MKYLPLLILITSGCAALDITMHSAEYDIAMDAVERPASISERYGDPVITKQDSADISKYVYADSIITIAWLPLPSKFYFELENKTNHSMKVIWDEAAFVDPNGRSMRIMHSGIKYTERENSQPSSIIVRGGVLSDLIFPTDYVSYTYGQYGGWNERYMFEPWIERSIEALQPALANKGKRVQVLLPIEVEGIVNEYIFSFVVNDVEIPKATQSY